MGLSVYSCEKIQPTHPVGANIEAVQFENLENIPLSFGQLISVTSPQAGIAHLWFEDESSTIRVVQLNYGKGKIGSIVWVVKRN